MICRSKTFFTAYKTSFALKKWLKRNLRYVTKFVIMLDLKFKFAFLILQVCEIKLALLVVIQIDLFYRLMYCFIIDNNNIQIIVKAGNVKCRTGKADNKQKKISIIWDKIFANVYNAIIIESMFCFVVSSLVQSLNLHLIIDKVELSKMILLRLMLYHLLRLKRRHSKP